MVHTVLTLAHVPSTDDFCRRTKFCTQFNRDVVVGARVHLVVKSSLANLSVASNPVADGVSTADRPWAHYVCLEAYHEKPVISIMLVYKFLAVFHAQLETYQTQHR